MRTNAIIVMLAALALVGITRASVNGAETVILAGNHPHEAETMVSMGDADPSQPLSMEVRFAVRNEAELNRLLAEQQNPASPNYRQWLASGEFNQRFGPRQSDIDAVAEWLRGEGFAVQSTSEGHIEFSGTVAQAQRTFATHIARFGDGSTYANVSDPAIPARFAGVIGNILGLDNMTRSIPVAPRPMPVKPRSPSSLNDGKTRQPRSRDPYAPLAKVNSSIGFGPQDVRTFYDETVTSGQDGTGGCIAIVGTSDFLDDAVATFQNQFMSSEAGFNITRVVHGTNPGTTHDNGEIEAELDLEWSHAVAPGAAQKFHFGKSLMNDIAGAVNDSCDIVSISFAFCGPPSGYARPIDALMKKAAALGESVFVSSGDAGAAGNSMVNCAPGNRRSVSEMAADPNVTAVGGTQFVPTYDASFNDIGYSNNEQVWNANGFAFASGGGASQVYRKPTYQSGPGVPSDARRDIPDVALIAGSPGTFWGHDLFPAAGSGIDCCINGTSLAAPIWAGFTRVLSQTVGFRLGPMNPLIYQLANLQFGPQGAASGFHDITVGNNSVDGVIGFDAGPGYDQASGWGTIDFDVFATAAKAQPAPISGPLLFPKTVSFGSRKVGASPAPLKIIKLTNPARNRVFAQMTADASLTNGTAFSIASSQCTAGAILPAGRSCSVGIVFNPQSASTTPVTDLLTFTDHASNSQQKVSLTGIGK
jgi:subtilase family serine protease